MSYRKHKTISTNSEPLKKWVWSLSSILLLCVISYGYFIRGMTVNIVTRVAMESELSTLNSKVSSLESEYIRAKNNVTMEKAQTIGFIAATNQKFVTKDVKTPGLSVLTTGF